MNRILVIGGTGNVGREVLLQLAGRNGKVRALVRNPERAGLPPQIETMRGDLTIPQSLEECLRGIDTVFLVWCAPSIAVGPALERILPRTRRIVLLSAPHKTAHPFFQQPNPMAAMQREIERSIEASGVEWTFLRPGMFASNVRGWWAPQIRAGSHLVRWPYAAVPTAPIDERDLAAVAARALCEHGHAGAEYVLTGPESLSQREQLSTIGDVIGRPLRMEEISPDAARRELLTVLPASSVVNMLLDAWGAAAGHPALVTSTVSEITGMPPRTFRDWVTDHAAEFRPS